MTRRLFILCLMFVVFAGVAFAQAPAAGNHAAIEKQLLTMERAVNEAFAKGDMKAFHANVANDAIVVDPGGVSKATDVDKMIQGLKIQSWNLDNSTFSWVNDTTVVLVYRWTGKGTFQGQPIPSPTWASTVWTNRGGKWIAVFHQETEAMMPPPAAAPTPAKK